MFHITKTQIAKKAVHMIVAGSVTSVTVATVSEYTDIDEESLGLEVGAWVFGHLVARQTDAYTDAMIDKIVTKWQSRKENAEIVEAPAE